MPAPPIGSRATGAADRASGPAGPAGARPSDQAAMQSALAPGLPGAEQEQAAAGLQALMGRIRAVDQEIQGLAADVPELQALVESTRQQLKQMVITVAQMAPTATASGGAVPV